MTSKVKETISSNGKGGRMGGFGEKQGKSEMT